MSAFDLSVDAHQRPFQSETQLKLSPAFFNQNVGSVQTIVTTLLNKGKKGAEYKSPFSPVVLEHNGHTVVVPMVAMFMLAQWADNIVNSPSLKHIATAEVPLFKILSNITLSGAAAVGTVKVVQETSGNTLWDGITGFQLNLIETPFKGNYISSGIPYEHDLTHLMDPSQAGDGDRYSGSESTASGEDGMLEALAPNSPWELIDAVLGVSRRVLLTGPPGTGKTFAATRLGMPEGGLDVYSVTLTEETPAAEVRGHFIPKGDEMVWMHGPGVKAWIEPARLIINEIDHASPDVHSLLFALLDDPDFARLTLPTGETVRPKEGFQVVATMNGVPEDLPPALRDRFPVTIDVNEVNPMALKALSKDLQWVARNSAIVPDEDRRISIRAWMEFDQLRTKIRGESTQEKNWRAAQAVFGYRAEEALRSLASSRVQS